MLETNAINITFSDVNIKLKNDTGVSFPETAFINGDGDGDGTDFGFWGVKWSVK